MKKWFEEYGTVVIVIILIVALIFLALFIKKGKQVESVADPVMSSAPISDEDQEAVEAAKEDATKETKTSTVNTSAGSTSIKYKDGQTWSRWTKSSSNTVGAKIVTSNGKTYVDVSKATGAGENEYNYIEIPDKDAKISETAQAEKYVQINVTTDDKSFGTATGGGVVKQNSSINLTATPVEGYELAAWTTSNGDVLSVENPYMHTASAGTNIIATWKEQTATVTYNFNDESTPNETVSIDYLNAYTIKEEEPIRDDYTFTGWNTSQDGTGTAYKTKEILKEAKVSPVDVTLYAQWKKTEAKALLLEDKSVHFVYDFETYNVGDSYKTSLLTSSNITKVCTVPKNTRDACGWRGSTIESAVFEDSFKDFKPITTQWFFSDCVNLSSIEHLENLNTSNVENMTYMFYKAGYNASSISYDLSDLDVSKAKNLSYMFQMTGYNATSFNLGNINNWDVSSATDLSYMFNKAGYNATNFSLGDLSNWNTANATTMSAMFATSGRNSKTWSIGDLSKWNVSNVTTLSAMFSEAAYSASSFNIGSLENWNTSKATNMSGIFKFSGCDATAWNVGDLSKWDVSNVTAMNGMFSSTGRKATTWSVGDLSEWNTSKATTMGGMFYQAGYKATTWSVGDLSGWDTSNVTDMNTMFSESGYLTATYNLGDLNHWDTSNVTSMYRMFSHAGRNATTWSIGKLKDWNVSKVTNMDGMFLYAGSKTDVFDIGNLSAWNVSNVTDMSYMFAYAGESAKTFNADLTDWNVSNVTDMEEMFNSCAYSAKTLNIGDLSNWNTAKNRSMYCMFYKFGASATDWSIGDLSNWNVSNVYNMYRAFSNCGNSATNWSIGDLSNWDVSNVIKMTDLFSGSGYRSTTYELKINNWNVAKGVEVNSLFEGAGKNAQSVNIEVKNWDVSHASDISNLFEGCGGNATTWNVTFSGWVFGEGYNADCMFRGIPVKELHIEELDLSKAGSLRFMFTESANLEKIYCNYDWSASTTIHFDLIWGASTKLQGGKGTKVADVYNSNAAGPDIFRPDASGHPGLFTGGENGFYITIASTDESLGKVSTDNCYRYAPGNMTVVASPKKGYILKGWKTTEDGSSYISTDASYTFNATEPIALYADFEKDPNYTPPSIAIESTSSSTFTFAKNANDYYESNNKGRHSTSAIAKVTITLPEAQDIPIDLINSGENNYDYGTIYALDETSPMSKSVWSGKGKSSTSVQNYTFSNVSAGTHVFYIKYQKDGSASSGNDSLQFKLIV